MALDTPDQLKEMLGGDVISLELDGRVDDLMAVLKNLEWVNTMKKHGDHLNLTVETAEKRIPEIITTAQKIGVVVRSVNLHKPSLEDVFLHFTGKTIREQEVSQIQRNRETVKRRMHR